jgi:hypothetical protein
MRPISSLCAITKRLASALGVTKMIVILFIVLFTYAVYIASEYQMTPFGIRKRFQIWSTKPGDVTFILVSQTVVSQFRLQRAFIFQALNEQKNEFVIQMKDGMRLSNINLAIVYPEMTPYVFRMVPEGEVNPHKVPI